MMSIKSIPMMMTWSRVVLIPVFLICYYAPIEDARFWAGLAFMIAAITDWFDGYLARKMGTDSKLGAFLDPVADKLIVAAALIVVAAEYHDNIYVIISAVLIMMREIGISALREWMAENNAREVVAVSNLGKIKTASQLAALTWLIYGGTLWGVNWGELGFPMLYFAAFLTVVTWIQYTKAALPEIIRSTES
ncbi:CDP-diacylglycerol--glycerol-3-phosphate 3-phosphatidyltransferase [Thiomicrorhabdus lithotrophica]|uniref:CDP-diacylglycerol--glycerol-3-phosphate 3-phosphatidyltransferase n=1 Tax=Thiomicrorhabdus lithotrophica TaxID=2949997 RepID=A0ABY8CCH1_9GAMM|nr:CDP-diacylglycerol--glycerol-3-phosphate 3-phosphatidyltransferase [Thiomicrorhabdus lithotrophica]WEJ63665.1 CDP-diacylglycerol--glycerol-3-phosphate 3-phosphatidyltransferase [Thiomicrorhabdus lithotrophica]